MSEEQMQDNGKEGQEALVMNEPISLYWELRWLLLAGIIIFSIGIGGLLYNSSGDLVHKIAVMAVAGICVACFTYGIKRKSPFSLKRVEEPNTFFDFIILLGALSLLTTFAYLQFRFNLFGSQYGLATFIPMVLLFFAAYFFDHAGVLGMAVTNLAAWAGIVATPNAFGLMQVLIAGPLIITGIALAFLLESLSWLSEKKEIKTHFAPVYRWAALNLAFISVLSGMFNLNVFIYSILLIVLAIYYYKVGVRKGSFGYLLCLGIYLYIGCAYLFIRLLENIDVPGMGPVYLGIIYFMASSALFAIFLVKQYKKLKDAHIQ